MALTKAEMAERLFDEVGLNKREAKEFVDAFFDVLREALEQGRQVKLSGFGNFDLRRKNQRPGRNPKTGEEIPISARTVPLAQLDRVLLRVRVEHLVAGQPQARGRQLGGGRIRVVVQNPGLGRAGRGCHGCGKGYSESSESW